MKDTPMVKFYENGELKFLSQEDYIDLICKGNSNASRRYGSS